MERFRLLRADEIEARVSTINEKGLTLLLYITARSAMDILDETVGCLNWERTHQLIDGRTYCTISIWDDSKKCFVSKQDIGTANYTETEKSECSDSFKRACVNVGIGRELYTAPFIWVSSDKADIRNKGDKYFTYDKFKVASISYNEDRAIDSLVIVNQRGEEVYRYEKQTKKDKTLSKDQIKEMNSEMIRTGVTMDDIKKRYDLECSVAEIPEATYKKIMRALKITSNAA